MKSIIVSDLHAGELSHGSIDPETGYNTRLLDTKRILEEVVEYSIKHNIENIIIAGDIYNIKNPKNFVRFVFASVITKAVRANKKVYIITGNHDQTSSHYGGHSLSEMQKMSAIIDNLKIISYPEIIKVGNIQFGFFPYVNKGECGILDDSTFNDWNKEQLLKMSKELDKEYKSILICHLETDKSLVHVYEETLGNVIELSFLKKLKFNLIFSGHIHKKQQLSKNIYHIGSMVKTSFNEEGEEKYFAVVNHDDLHIEFIKTNDREFKTFKIDLSESTKKLAAFIRKIKNTDVSEMITRLVVKVNADDLESIETMNEVYEDLFKRSWKCVGKEEEIVREDMESTKISDKHAPSDALKTFILENKEMFGDDSEACKKEGLSIIEEVKK